MSEIVRAQQTNMLFWNTLYSADTGHQFAYFESLLNEYDPEAAVLAECTDKLYERVASVYPNTTFLPGATVGNITYGMAAYSRLPAEVTPFSRWPQTESRLLFGLGKKYIDNREFLRMPVVTEAVGSIALVGIHVTHPHHIWAPSLALRRILEWEAIAQQIEFCMLPNQPYQGRVIVVGDTNTFLHSTMQKRLGLHVSGGLVIRNEGDGTWGYLHPRAPRIASVDKIAVTKPLVGRVTGITLPHIVGGIPSPSDHRAVLATLA